jgi:hypothetical protein
MDSTAGAREVELRGLREAWLEVLAGKPRIIWIEGPQGTGKTWLAETLLDEIRDEKRFEGSVAVGHARCVDLADGGEPLRVAWDACARFVDSYEPPPSLMSRVLDSKLFEATSEILGAIPALGTAALPMKLAKILAGGKAASQASTFRRSPAQVVRQTFLEVASQRPSAVFLDDLHWADAQTVNLWFELMREMLNPEQKRSLLLVATVRSLEASKSHLLDRFEVMSKRLDSRGRSISTIPMRGLGASAFSMLLRERAGIASTAPGLMPWLHQRTGGVPAAALELVAALRDDGLLREVDAHWDVAEPLRRSDKGYSAGPRLTAWLERANPARSLAEVSVRGLDAVPQHVLAVGALWGERFPSGVLAQVLGRSEVDVLFDLRRLARTEVIREAPREEVVGDSVQGAFEFVQPALREVLIADLGRRERALLSSRYADVLLDEETRMGGEYRAPTGADRSASRARVDAREWSRRDRRREVQKRRLVHLKAAGRIVDAVRLTIELLTFDLGQAQEVDELLELSRVRELRAQITLAEDSLGQLAVNVTERSDVVLELEARLGALAAAVWAMAQRFDRAQVLLDGVEERAALLGNAALGRWVDAVTAFVHARSGRGEVYFERIERIFGDPQQVPPADEHDPFDVRALLASGLAPDDVVAALAGRYAAIARRGGCEALAKELDDIAVTATIKDIACRLLHRNLLSEAADEAALQGRFDDAIERGDGERWVREFMTELRGWVESEVADLEEETADEALPLSEQVVKVVEASLDDLRRWAVRVGESATDPRRLAAEVLVCEALVTDCVGSVVERLIAEYNEAIGDGEGGVDQADPEGDDDGSIEEVLQAHLFSDQRRAGAFQQAWARRLDLVDDDLSDLALVIAQSDSVSSGVREEALQWLVADARRAGDAYDFHSALALRATMLTKAGEIDEATAVAEEADAFGESALDRSVGDERFELLFSLEVLWEGIDEKRAAAWRVRRAEEFGRPHPVEIGKGASRSQHPRDPFIAISELEASARHAKINVASRELMEASEIARSREEFRGYVDNLEEMLAERWSDEAGFAAPRQRERHRSETLAAWGRALDAARSTGQIGRSIEVLRCRASTSQLFEDPTGWRADLLEAWKLASRHRQVEHAREIIDDVEEVARDFDDDFQSDAQALLREMLPRRPAWLTTLLEAQLPADLGRT